ncbi:MAG: ferric reductase-like transmembrane domain-containing protein [Solirubrobacteraceae bacterium]
MLAAAISPHLYWFISRAAGTAALLLSSVAVGVGLMMGGRLIKRGPDLRVVHEALSLATIVALLVHAVSLLGDNFLKLSVIDISLPFSSSYKEPWMGIGIVSGWALIALGLSYYARARIGVNRWRTLHRFTALAWIGGLVHSLGEGTDAGQTWFLAATAIVTAPALLLLIVRMSKPPADAAPARVTR